MSVCFKRNGRSTKQEYHASFAQEASGWFVWIYLPKTLFEALFCNLRKVLSFAYLLTFSNPAPNRQCGYVFCVLST